MGPLENHLQDPLYSNWVKNGLALKITNDTVKPFIITENENFKTVVATTCSATTGNSFEFEIRNNHRFGNPSFDNSDKNTWSTDSWEVAKCFMPPLKRYELCTSLDADFSATINIIINNRHFEPLVSCDLGAKGNIFSQARTMRNNIMHSNDLKVDDIDLQNNLDLLIRILGSFTSALPNYSKTVDTINKLKTDQLRIELDDILDVRRERLIAMEMECERLVLKAKQEVQAGQVVIKEMVEVAKEGITNHIDEEIKRLNQTIQLKSPISKEHTIRKNFIDGCRHSLLKILHDHIERLRPPNKNPDDWTLSDFLGKIEYIQDTGDLSGRHRDMLYPQDDELLTPENWDLFLLCQVPLIRTRIQLPNNVACYLQEVKTTRDKLLENPDSVGIQELASLCDFLDGPLKETTMQIFCRDSVECDVVLVDSTLKSWRSNDYEFSQTQVHKSHSIENKKLLKRVDELERLMEENKKAEDKRYNEIMAMINGEKNVETGHLGTRPKIKSSIKLNPINCGGKENALKVQKNLTSEKGNIAMENGSINVFNQMMNLDESEPKEGSIILEVTLSSVRDLIEFWDKCLDGRAVEALKDVRNTYRKFINCPDLEFEVILTKGEVDRCLTQIVDDLAERMNARGILRGLDHPKLFGSITDKGLGTGAVQSLDIGGENAVNVMTSGAINVVGPLNTVGFSPQTDKPNYTGTERGAISKRPHMGLPVAFGHRTKEETIPDEFDNIERATTSSKPPIDVDVSGAGASKAKEIIKGTENEEEANRLVKFLRQIAENLEGGQISTVRKYLDTIVVSAKENDKKAFDKAIEDFINAATFKSGISVNLIKQSVRGFLIIQEQPSFGELVSSKLSSIEAKQREREQIPQFAEISPKPFAGASSVKSSVLIEEDIEVSDMDEAEATERIRTIQEREREKPVAEPPMKFSRDPFESVSGLKEGPTKSPTTDRGPESLSLGKDTDFEFLPSISGETKKSTIQPSIETDIYDPKTSSVGKNPSTKISSISPPEEPAYFPAEPTSKIEQMDVSSTTIGDKSPKE